MSISAGRLDDTRARRAGRCTIADARHRDEGSECCLTIVARGESARRGVCDDAPAKAAADTLAMAWEYILSFGAVPVDARAGR